ncbi:hypothetical protein CsSME_00053482 [Camellia sinensis var. sinensis]
MLLVGRMGSDTNAGGMKWKDLNDSTNGMKELLIIMVVEWFVLLFVAYYVDQVISSRSGVRKSPLFLLRKFQGQTSSFGKTSLISDESRDFDQAEKADVARESFVNVASICSPYKCDTYWSHHLHIVYLKTY